MIIRDSSNNTNDSWDYFPQIDYVMFSLVETNKLLIIMSGPEQGAPVTLKPDIASIYRNLSRLRPVLTPMTAPINMIDDRRIHATNPRPPPIVREIMAACAAALPSRSITLIPSILPRVVPIIQPRVQPIIQPRVQPIVQPIIQPRVQPIVQPRVQPIVQPRVQPRVQPIIQPIIQPRVQPIIQPIIQPRVRPVLRPIQPIVTITLPTVIPREPNSQPATINTVGSDRTYGYLLTFRKPEEPPQVEGDRNDSSLNFNLDLRLIIIKLTSKARDELMRSSSVKSIDDLLALKEWTVPVNDNGTKLLSHLYLSYPHWFGWTPNSWTPISMEGIYTLTCKDLRRFTERLYPRAGRQARKKLPLFRQLISRMIRSDYIFDSEAKLFGDELMESLELNKQDILRELPLDASLKRCNRILLSFKHVVFLSEIGKRKVDPIELIQMGQAGWLRLATEERVVKPGGSFAFSDLILSLTKTRRLDPKYIFMRETEFWKFYQKYYQYLPKLAAVYSEELTESKAAAALTLFEEGIFDLDLQPERLALLKRIKLIGDVPKRTNQYKIPGLENFPTPRRIITSDLILADSGSTENSTDGSNNITRESLIKYIRETDLMFYDAVDPYPHLTIERSTIGGSSYLQNWQRPSGPTPYHYLTSSQIEGIMSDRSITIPGNLEGRRLALAGLDQGDSAWKLEVLDVLRPENLTVFGTHYLAGHNEINLLNDQYPESLIKIAISLKVLGIGGPNVETTRRPRILKDRPENGPHREPSSEGPENGPHREPSSEDGIVVATIETKVVKVINELPKESSWKTIQEAELELTKLVKYPICLDARLYLRIRGLGRTGIMLLIEMLFEGNVEAILRPKEQHLFLLSRGYVLSPVDEGVIQRHASISNLESSKRDLLLNFHGYPNNRVCLAKLALETPNPIDASIIREDLAELINLLGIVVPGGISDEDYLRDNINLCKCIATRSPSIRLPTATDPATLSLGNLAKIKDQEMIEALGVRPVFTNRMDLINRVRQLWYEPGFFESIGRNCVNKETTLMSETSDKTETMIGYGLLDEYRCYEILELHGSFYLGDDQKVHFRKPEVKVNFEFDEILSLDELVGDLFIRTVGDPDRLAELHNRISRGIEDHHEMDRETRRIYRDVAHLGRTGKERLKTWLRMLFDAGMYMRRWRGPGNPYPHTRNETRGGPDPAVTDQVSPLGRKIGLLQEMYNSFVRHIRFIVSRLTKVRYNQDESRYQVREGSIIELFQRIASGNECIRMASKHLVLSAAYYLRSFFHVRIDGFRPEDVIGIT